MRTEHPHTDIPLRRHERTQLCTTTSICATLLFTGLATQIATAQSTIPDFNYTADVGSGLKPAALARRNCAQGATREALAAVRISTDPQLYNTLAATICDPRDGRFHLYATQPVAGGPLVGPSDATVVHELSHLDFNNTLQAAVGGGCTNIESVLANPFLQVASELAAYGEEFAFNPSPPYASSGIGPVQAAVDEAYNLPIFGRDTPAARIYNEINKILAAGGIQASYNGEKLIVTSGDLSGLRQARNAIAKELTGKAVRATNSCTNEPFADVPADEPQPVADAEDPLPFNPFGDFDYGHVQICYGSCPTPPPDTPPPGQVGVCEGSNDCFAGLPGSPQPVPDPGGDPSTGGGGYGPDPSTGDPLPPDYSNPSGGGGDGNYCD